MPTIQQIRAQLAAIDARNGTSREAQRAEERARRAAAIVAARDAALAIRDRPTLPDNYALALRRLGEWQAAQPFNRETAEEAFFGDDETLVRATVFQMAGVDPNDREAVLVFFNTLAEFAVRLVQ